MVSDDKKTMSPQYQPHCPEDNKTGRTSWPVKMQRTELKWFPASSRLIGLVRAHVDKFVLPPAVVRKASWRE